MTPMSSLPADHPAHQAVFTADQLVATVPPIADDLDWVDRSLQNASDYVVYRLIPGAYPVEFVDHNYQPCAPDVTGVDPRSYYICVSVEVIELRAGGVNRLLGASSDYHRGGRGRMSKTFTSYAYYASEGHVMACAEAPTEQNRWHREPVLILHVREGEKR